MKAGHNGHNGHSGHVTETPDVSHIKNVDVTHEVSDVELRGIVMFLVGLTLLGVATYLLMLLMFYALNRQEETKERESIPPPMALSEKERMPPEPRLQSAPGFGEGLAKETGAKEGDPAKRKDRVWEIEQLRMKWEDELEHGPKDPEGKRVGLSIEDAKKLVLSGNALPERTGVQPADRPEAYGVDMPTAASSGRMAEKRKQ